MPSFSPLELASTLRGYGREDLINALEELKEEGSDSIEIESILTHGPSLPKQLRSFLLFVTEQHLTSPITNQLLQAIHKVRPSYLDLVDSLRDLVSTFQARNPEITSPLLGIKIQQFTKSDPLFADAVNYIMSSDLYNENAPNRSHPFFRVQAIEYLIKNDLLELTNIRYLTQNADPTACARALVYLSENNIDLSSDLYLSLGITIDYVISSIDPKTTAILLNYPTTLSPRNLEILNKLLGPQADEDSGIADLVRGLKRCDLLTEEVLYRCINHRHFKSVANIVFQLGVNTGHILTADMLNAILNHMDSIEDPELAIRCASLIDALPSYSALAEQVAKETPEGSPAPLIQDWTDQVLKQFPAGVGSVVLTFKDLMAMQNNPDYFSDAELNTTTLTREITEALSKADLGKAFRECTFNKRLRDHILSMLEHPNPELYLKAICRLCGAASTTSETQENQETAESIMTNICNLQIHSDLIAADNPEQMLLCLPALKKLQPSFRQLLITRYHQSPTPYELRRLDEFIINNAFPLSCTTAIKKKTIDSSLVYRLTELHKKIGSTLNAPMLTQICSSINPADFAEMLIDYSEDSNISLFITELAQEDSPMSKANFLNCFFEDITSELLDLIHDIVKNSLNSAETQQKILNLLGPYGVTESALNKAIELEGNPEDIRVPVLKALQTALLMCPLKNLSTNPQIHPFKDRSLPKPITDKLEAEMKKFNAFNQPAPKPNQPPSESTSMPLRN